VAASHFYQGNVVPVRDELSVADLTVRGELPNDLAGVYMRNGPNPKYEPIAYTYPFDGDGMVHAVYFDKGKARYRNRFVQTAGLAVEDRAGHAVYGSVTHPTPPDPSLLAPGDPPFLKNVANINVIHHGGHYLALYESAPAHELTRDLETVGQFDFAGAINGMTAHPRKDVETGELHFFTYSPVVPYLTYYVADREGKVVTDRPIDLPNPTMIHDFVITTDHVLFFDCPVVFDLSLAQKGEVPLQWRPELGTRIYVLDRRDPSAKPIVVEDEPFFVYHFVNAYDRNGSEIVVDYVRHRLLSFGPGGEGSNPAMHRMVIDLSARKATDVRADDPAQMVEFPRVDDRRTGREHRYGYAASDSGGANGGEDEFDSLTQYDYERGTVSVHKPGAGRSPGEACFVPRPGATAEDDGYVVSFVHDAATDKSELVLIDAANFDADPVAAIELPRRVPSGLHGNWMALDE